MEALYLAAVCAVVPGLGRSKIMELMDNLGGAQRLFEADAAALRATGICQPGAIAKFVANRRPELPRQLEAFCRREGVQLVSIFDAAYPAGLRQIADPPLVLYVRGQLPADPYAVAVVGSRAATPYGRRAAAYFAGALAQQGIPIISGGARGIDTAAHEACLQAGGRTVAVLGSGLDVLYPSENRRLFAKIIEQGALVTEYPPGVQPLPANFPARNRIIVGLARAVLVAEAAQRSGAIITANIAADEGRDVFCVPGNIFDGSSIGCHELIRTGAKLVDKPQDILDEKEIWLPHVGNKAVQPNIFTAAQELPPTPAPKTSELGGRLLELLREGALSLEVLTERSGVAFAAVSMELLDLQVAGLVATDQTGRYYRR